MQHRSPSSPPGSGHRCLYCSRWTSGNPQPGRPGGHFRRTAPGLRRRDRPWHRLRKRQEAGIWDHRPQTVPPEHSDAQAPECSRPSINPVLVHAKEGGENRPGPSRYLRRSFPVQQDGGGSYDEGNGDYEVVRYEQFPSVEGLVGDLGGLAVAVLAGLDQPIEDLLSGRGPKRPISAPVRPRDRTRSGVYCPGAGHPQRARSVRQGARLRVRPGKGHVD